MRNIKDFVKIFFLFLLLFLNKAEISNANYDFLDQFTAPNNTSLQIYSANWTDFSASPGHNSGIILNNKIEPSTYNIYYLFTLRTFSDGCVSMDVDGPGYYSLAVRNNFSGSNGYIFQLQLNKFNIYKNLELVDSGQFLFDSNPKKIKVCSDKQMHKFYMNEILITNYQDSQYNHGYYGFGLGLSNSGDNFTIYIPDETASELDVPYYSQNDLPWGMTEYDSAKKINFSDSTMNRWGCAVTSAAMVLNYHNMTEFSNGTKIDPGTLNTWLTLNQGYITGKGSSGSYSYINWDKIAVLTRDLYAQGKSLIKLVHQQVKGDLPYLQSILTNDLTTGNSIGRFPDIIKVANSQTSSHFVVAKGINASTVSINDPEWKYQDLTSFNNTFSQIDRFIPSHTDFSTLHFLINSDIKMLITDPAGNNEGEIIGNNTAYNEILDADYGYNSPISNPGIFNEDLGTGVNDFWMSNPEEGEYRITLTSDHDTLFTFNSSSFQISGDADQHVVVGRLYANIPKEFILHYYPNQSSIFERTVTYESTLDDISAIYELGFINMGVRQMLMSYIKNAQRMSNSDKTNEKKMLEIFDQQILKVKEKSSDTTYYPTLKYNIDSLKNEAF